MPLELLRLVADRVPIVCGHVLNDPIPQLRHACGLTWERSVGQIFHLRPDESEQDPFGLVAEGIFLRNNGTYSDNLTAI